MLRRPWPGWHALGKASSAHLLIGLGVGALKSEVVIYLSQTVTHPGWLRFWVYGVLGIGVTLLLAPLSAWCSWYATSPIKEKK